MGVFDEYFPFDKGFGAPATTARWRKMAQLWCADGVLAGYQNRLTTTLAGSVATIATGAVFMHGYYAELLGPQAITGVTGNGTIVAKADLVNEVCSIYYKSGALDYANYEQSLNNWEVPLWLVTGGSTLTDLRSFVSGGMGLAWSGQVAGPQTVVPSSTANFSVLYPHISYPTQVQLTGTGLVSFSDASLLQTATISVAYQYSLSDAQSTPALVLQWPGGGPAGVAVSMPVSLSGQIPVTQGKKTVGWLVQTGPGPQVNVSNMTVTLAQTSAGIVTAS